MLVPFLHSFLILQVTSSALGTLLLPSIADPNSDYNVIADYRYYNGGIHVVPKSNAILRGYSYTSHDADGGRSKVIFLSGPNSEYVMKRNMDAMQVPMREVMSGESLQSENKDATVVDSTSAEPTSSSFPSAEVLMSPTVAPNIKEEIKVSKEMAEDKSEVTTQSDKSVFRQAPLLPVPYPILRFGSVHPQLLSSYPGYYESPSIFRNQYYVPLQDSFFPLHTSYYNPYVSALYQQPQYTSSLSNSIEGVRENFVNSDNPDASLIAEAKTNKENQQPESRSQQLSTPEEATTAPGQAESNSEMTTPMPEEMTSAPSTEEPVSKQTEKMGAEEEMKIEDAATVADAASETTATTANAAKAA